MLWRLSCKTKFVKALFQPCFPFLPRSVQMADQMNSRLPLRIAHFRLYNRNIRAVDRVGIHMDRYRITLAHLLPDAGELFSIYIRFNCAQRLRSWLQKRNISLLRIHQRQAVAVIKCATRRADCDRARIVPHGGLRIFTLRDAQNSDKQQSQRKHQRKKHSDNAFRHFDLRLFKWYCL